MAMSDSGEGPHEILTIRLPARSTKRPASGSPSPIPDSSDIGEAPGDFVGNKVRLIESQNSNVDGLRTEIKALEQRRDLQSELASAFVVKLRRPESAGSSQTDLNRTQWQRGWEERAVLLREAQATIEDFQRQKQAARDHHGFLQDIFKSKSQQLHQIKDYLQRSVERQNVRVPGFGCPPTLKCVFKSVGERVTQLLAEERPKIQADWEAKLDGAAHQSRVERRRLDAEIQSLKTQVCNQSPSRVSAKPSQIATLQQESQGALAQITQVDAQVESQMKQYSENVQQQVEEMINGMTLECQTAESSFSSQEDSVAKQWETKVDALQSELQGVLSTEQCLITERVAPGVHGSQTDMNPPRSLTQFTCTPLPQMTLATWQLCVITLSPIPLSIRFVAGSSVVDGTMSNGRPDPQSPASAGSGYSHYTPSEWLIPSQRAIRKLMQQLLGIRYDHFIGEAVERGHSTPLELAVRPGKPTLSPFCPCWEDLGGQWNQDLGELFLERFQHDHPTLAGNETQILAHFHQRLRTLREALGLYGRRLVGADPKLQIAGQKRRSERRRAIYGRRKKWTINNGQLIRASDGSYPVLLLYQMVKLLNTDGMSSEQSTDNGWTVVEKNWRHPDVVRLLRWIDLKRSSDGGEQTLGLPYHHRLRLPYGQAAVSLRIPIAGLPINFYHPVWYNGLTSAVQRRLRATEATPLPLHIMHDD
ncbi:hypothetical protein C8R46DRAFT_1044838 [Mycena filopes]|nr:hypothetical protein C8R46DRAFT_1044838 [Mycena filopes]